MEYSIIKEKTKGLYFMIGYVYMLESPDGKKYVGRTLDFDRRMKQYESRSRNSSPIQDAVNEIGFANFKKCILETVEGNREEVVREINKLEAAYIKRFNTTEDGYNVYRFDSRGGKRYHLSDATREKMRKSQTGRKHSEESRAKRAGENAYQGKRVKSKTLGKEFCTLKEAANYVGVKGGCKISECINGKRKSAGEDPKTGARISDWEFV